jgi:hypothetical protein
MKIGQVMYNQQSGQSSSSENQEQQGEQKSEGEDKKN